MSDMILNDLLDAMALAGFTISERNNARLRAAARLLVANRTARNGSAAEAETLDKIAFPEKSIELLERTNISREQRHAAEAESAKWMPTPENINALPEAIRNFIHDLEAMSDPAQIVRENHCLREDNAEFEHRYAASKDAVTLTSETIRKAEAWNAFCQKNEIAGKQLAEYYAAEAASKETETLSDRDYENGYGAGYDQGATDARQETLSDEQDAARYRWLRDYSEPSICAFYLSVGMGLHGVRFRPETVDEAIDAQIAQRDASKAEGE